MAHKCMFCSFKTDKKDHLESHLDEKHQELIPLNMSADKYYFIYRNKKPLSYNGKCQICGSETGWDEVTGRFFTFCSTKCIEAYRTTIDNRMMQKYGKKKLTDDPDFQQTMLENRKITKDYIWSDGTIKKCVGTYELDAAQFLDVFMRFPSKDVMIPSPHVYEYDHVGKKRFYRPDIYIPTLNVEIECKDGGDNPNMHHKIQAIDKAKEKLKEEAVRKAGKTNYIKVTNKNYEPLLDFFAMVKRGFIEDSDNKKMLFVINEGVFDISLVSENSETGEIKSFTDDCFIVFIKDYIKESYEIYVATDMTLTTVYPLGNSQILLNRESLLESTKGLQLLKVDRDSQLAKSINSCQELNSVVPLYEELGITNATDILSNLLESSDASNWYETFISTTYKIEDTLNILKENGTNYLLEKFDLDMMGLNGMIMEKLLTESDEAMVIGRFGESALPYIRKNADNEYFVCSYALCSEMYERIDYIPYHIVDIIRR